MTEDEAHRWVHDRFGSAAHDRLASFVSIVVSETKRQNLIAASTVETIWTRHIVDSAQLIANVEHAEAGLWIDIGSGAGFPGIVAAVLQRRPVLMVEPRRKRALFLEETTRALRIDASVACCSIETVRQKASILSARAVAPLTSLLETAHQCADLATLWLLPKGRTAREEIANATQSWHGVFHVEQSITDPASLIVLASKVSRR